MKRILSFVLTVALSVGFMYVPAGAAEKKPERPVIGIAWRADADSEFYTNICIAVEQAGADHVLLEQVRSADLEYDSSGRLKGGVSKTGALTYSAGKMIRCNTWHGSNAARAASKVDAVIFTGGEDISPSLYYRPVKWHGIEAERDYNAERDVSDYLLMSYCLDKDIPIMGFCRGMQMLCVVSGAEVIQDIPAYFEEMGVAYNFEHRREKSSPDEYRDYTPHDVTIEKDSVFYEIVGRTKITGCPSWHHQAVKNVDNTRLKVTGTLSTNGIDIIEAVERTDKTFAVGFQFHPEAAVAKYVNKAANAGDFMSKKTALRFFERLIDEVSGTEDAVNEAA